MYTVKSLSRCWHEVAFGTFVALLKSNARQLLAESRVLVRESLRNEGRFPPLEE